MKEYHDKARASQKAKVTNIVGHARDFAYAPDRASAINGGDTGKSTGSKSEYAPQREESE
jgi:hypothetical protein